MVKLVCITQIVQIKVFSNHDFLKKGWATKGMGGGGVIGILKNLLTNTETTTGD